MLELDGRTLTYPEFREKCLEPNLPAIIRHANGLSGSWFDVGSLTRHLSPEGLLDCFGEDHLVPAYAMPTVAGEGGASGPAAHDSCEAIPLGRVLGSWALSGRGAHALYYLKDWHMQQETEARRGVARSEASRGDAHGAGLYRVPDYLGPDWLDAFCGAVRGRGQAIGPVQGERAKPSGLRDAPPFCGFGDGHGDYRFAYIGPTGTWTPLHYDVFGTYSWSFNVCGEKRWFFPTKEGNEFLKQHAINGFPTPPDIRVLEGFEYWSFVQHPGELVFVPSQYYHQVHNIKAEVLGVSTNTCSTSFSSLREMRLPPLTISVNHNWCNEFCIENMVCVFLNDVDYLRRNLRPEDMAAAYGSNDPVLWTQKLEEMLLNGTNWNFMSMFSFLGYIKAQFRILDESAINTLASLEKRLHEAHTKLFT